MNIRRLCWAVLFLAAVGGIGAETAAENSSAPAPGALRAAGKIEFPISSAAEVRPEFERGVALLHSFFYEEARRIFTAVAEKDPNCAMAQWGIAMTWWHPIWTPPTPKEMKSGTAAIDKATAMKPSTDREGRFISALGVYYHAADTAAATGGPVGQSCHGPVGSRERALAYEKEMRGLAQKYPDDMEAQTFYA